MTIRSRTRAPIDSNFYFPKVAFVLIKCIQTPNYHTIISLLHRPQPENTNTKMKRVMKRKATCPEERAEQASLIQELHGDLSRRYQKHELEIEALWRSFDTEQRIICLTTPPLRREDLDHSKAGKQCAIPEWNLRDMAEPGPDFALALFKDCVTVSILGQYLGPKPSGCPGDHDVISQVINTRGIPDRPGEYYLSFANEGEDYGKFVNIPSPLDEGFEHFTAMVQRRLFISSSNAALVLLRQTHLL